MKNFRPATHWLLLLFCLAIPALPALAQGSGQKLPGGKLKVVASIAPLADFARQVGGDHVEVILLLPPGASPHTYEPPPKTVRKISEAKVFLEIGAGLEFWADRLVAATAAQIITVRCSEGVDLIRGEGRALSNVDPHIWLDPVISMGIVRKIEAAFSRADPGDSSAFKKNASAYLTLLSALDREIAERVKGFRTREYITFHPAWSYFARRYGLKVSGVIEEAPGKEPTPKHIDRILSRIRAMKTKVVFAEPQFSPRLAEAIADEAGGRVLFLDPLGGEKGRQTYVELMEYNLSIMEKAMK
jgi:zinc transport system substrate-binding protein